MSPVVARCLRGCLALVALLVSAWGNLRAAVEQPIDDRADGPAVTDGLAARAAGSAQPDAETVIVAQGYAPVPTWIMPDSGDAIAVRLPIVDRPAPGPRRGSAGGPRAP